MDGPSLLHLEALGRSAATLEQVDGQLGRLRSFLGRRLEEASREDLERFAENIASLRPSTRSWMLAYLAVYFRWLERSGRILMSPAMSLTRPRVPTELAAHKVVSETDARRLLDAPSAREPRGLRDRAMLEILYGSGLRRQELCGLDLSDWLVGDRLLVVRRAKRKKERLVPLGLQAAEAVDAYLRRGRSLLVSELITPALFLGSAGARLTGHAVHWIVRIHAERALGRRVTPLLTPASGGMSVAGSHEGHWSLLFFAAGALVLLVLGRRRKLLVVIALLGSTSLTCADGCGPTPPPSPQPTALGTPVVHATSGEHGCLNNPACRASPWAGPIPEGQWVLNVSAVSNPGHFRDWLRNQIGDWGDWRVRLEPYVGTEIGPRSGFYLHGGSVIGSAGCIDIGGGTYGDPTSNQILRDILADPDGVVTLVVWGG